MRLGKPSSHFGGNAGKLRRISQLQQTGRSYEQSLGGAVAQDRQERHTVVNL